MPSQGSGPVNIVGARRATGVCLVNMAGVGLVSTQGDPGVGVCVRMSEYVFASTPSLTVCPSGCVPQVRR